MSETTAQVDAIEQPESGTTEPTRSTEPEKLTTPAESAEDPEDHEGEEAAKGNQATQLFEMLQAEESCELFRSDDDRAFVGLDGSHHQCPSKSLDSALKLYWYKSQGTICGRDTARNVAEMFEAIALIDEEIPVRSVHVRFAYIKDSGTGGVTLYIDLCERSKKRAIEIDARGFRIVNDPPVIFIRPAGSLPLPEPVRDNRKHRKALKYLGKLLRLRGDDYTTLLMFLISAIAPSDLRFILFLGGNAGAGKTTTARILRSIFDPSIHMASVKPSTKQDFYVLGQHTYVYCIDNLSGIPVWLADALCCLATGASEHTRQLYTNDGIHTFRYSRTVILTSISDLLWRQDLGSRSLSIQVPAIVNGGLSEEEINRRMDKVRPHVLGALCQAASAALKNPQAGLVKHRMQALADWTASAAPSLGLSIEDLASSVDSVVEDLNATHLESSPISEPLRKWAMKKIGENSRKFDHVLIKATADLLEELNAIATHAQSRHEHWPRNARSLGAKLAEIAPSLHALGITAKKHAGSAQRGWRIDFSKLAARVELPTRSNRKSRGGRE
jgi:hypothetical protein